MIPVYSFLRVEKKLLNIYLNSLQAIYISRITEGGAAAKDGKLRVGDRVISVSMAVFLTLFITVIIIKSL